ncbi:MAG: ABC transporter ATP-binding protein [Clostridiales bacterium]|jgi:multiple sugar transport system ATP-binding protein|nr:ABC transporter ATP-binding protein [Clostridiales bacterium]
MANIKLRNINKIFGNRIALENINIIVDDATLLSISGTIGSGKTTLLRIVAGLDDCTSGQIYIDDLLYNNISIQDRNFALVSNKPMLHNKWSVLDNIKFGIELRRMRLSMTRLQELCRELDIVQLLAFKPKQLKLAQLIKVSLCRALLREPKLIILDNPLCDLSSQDRHVLHKLILYLQDKYNVYMIYATDNVDDALDTHGIVALLHQGKIQQVGRAADIVKTPNNLHTLQYITKSKLNTIPATLYQHSNNLYCQTDAVSLVVPQDMAMRISHKLPTEVILAVQQSDAVIHACQCDRAKYNCKLYHNCMHASIVAKSTFHDTFAYYLRYNSQCIAAFSNTQFGVGDNVSLSISSNFYLFDYNTHDSLLVIPKYNTIDNVKLEYINDKLSLYIDNLPTHIDSYIYDTIVDVSVLKCSLYVLVAPQHIYLEPIGSVIPLQVNIYWIHYLFDTCAVYCRFGDKTIVVECNTNQAIHIGQKIQVYIDCGKIELYTVQGNRINSKYALNTSQIISTKQHTIQVDIADFAVVNANNAKLYRHNLRINCQIIDIDVLGDQFLIFFVLRDTETVYNALLDIQDIEYLDSCIELAILSSK